jgi:hypothetical protein
MYCVPLHRSVAQVKPPCHHPASCIRVGRITGRGERNVEKYAGWGKCNCLRKAKRGVESWKFFPLCGYNRFIYCFYFSYFSIVIPLSATLLLTEPHEGMKNVWSDALTD